MQGLFLQTPSPCEAIAHVFISGFLCAGGSNAAVTSYTFKTLLIFVSFFSCVGVLAVAGAVAARATARVAPTLFGPDRNRQRKTCGDKR